MKLNDRELQLSEKAMMSIMGVTLEGKLCGRLTCLNCGEEQLYNPVYGMGPPNKLKERYDDNGQFGPRYYIR